MKRVSFLMLLTGLAVSSVSARDTVVTYTAPPQAITSTDFTATVNGQSLVVYKDTRTEGYTSARYFVNFSMAGTVTMNVKWTLPFTTAIVLPRADKITPAVSGKSATFSFTGPRNISFESNDAGYGDNRFIPSLFIFANPLEVNIPSPTDPGVEYYGPGFHDIGSYDATSAKKTIYLAGGAYCKGKIKVSGVNDVLIMGRGIIYTSYSASVKDNNNYSISVNGCSGFRMQGITASHNDTWAISTLMQGNQVVIDNYHVIGDGENDDGINNSYATWQTYNRVFSATHDDAFGGNNKHFTTLNSIGRSGCCRIFSVSERAFDYFYKGCTAIGVNPCNDFPVILQEYVEDSCFRYENMNIEVKNGWMDSRGKNHSFRNITIPFASWGDNATGDPLVFENLVYHGKTVLQTSDCPSWSGTATFKATDAAAPTVTITSPARSDSCDVVTGTSITLGFTITNWAMASGEKGFHYFVNNVDKGAKYTADPIVISNLPIGPNALHIKLTDATGAYVPYQDAIVVTVTNNPAVLARLPQPRAAGFRGTVSKERGYVGIDGRVISRGATRMTASAGAAFHPGVYVTYSPDANARMIAIVK